MLLFKVLWSFDTMMALAACAGFIRYLFRGPLQKNITGTWLGLIALMVAIILSAGWLRVTDNYGTAWLLLGIMAAPGIVYLSLVTAIYLFGMKLKHI